MINLGWFDNSPGDDCLIDGVYVIKTDWKLNHTPIWTNTDLNSDNDAIVASLMTPGTTYGGMIPSVFRNIYVEDPPRVLFSLKIVPPLTQDPPVVDLTQPGVLNLSLENIFSPPSTFDNLIGFQIVNGSPLTGSMNIDFNNVVLTAAGGSTVLSSANAAAIGEMETNGGPISLVIRRAGDLTGRQRRRRIAGNRAQYLGRDQGI